MAPTELSSVSSIASAKGAKHRITPTFTPHNVDFLYTGEIVDVGIQDLVTSVETAFELYQQSKVGSGSTASLLQHSRMNSVGAEVDHDRP